MTSPETTGSTSSSLFARIKQRDSIAWERVSQLYGPLVYRSARKAGLQESDATDIVQEVFRSVASHVADLRLDRPGDSFRAWLWSITKNKIHDYFRRRARNPEAIGGSTAHEQMQNLPDSVIDEKSADELLKPSKALEIRALALIQTDFEPQTWQAFLRSAVDGQKAAEIAADLGMSLTAVYKAKSRVLARLRSEFGGLMD